MHKSLFYREIPLNSTLENRRKKYFFSSKLNETKLQKKLQPWKCLKKILLDIFKNHQSLLLMPIESFDEISQCQICVG